MVNTLDPVIETTHVASDNPYYRVCLAGSFSRGDDGDDDSEKNVGRGCHPDYLSREAHTILSRPGAFDGLRIHTDELDEVIARFFPGTLTVAIVMDSMDWFDPPSSPSTDDGKSNGNTMASKQITKLNRALKMGGRVLLRSAAREPWYIREFEALGFEAEKVGDREPGMCIDRVNMYASCWVLTKVEGLSPPTPGSEVEVGVGNGREGLGGDRLEL
jgi:betaine lipid synthase